MITLAEYLRGHDRTHPHLLLSDLRANALRTIEAANAMLVLAKGAGVQIEPAGDGRVVTSGWRPPDVNARTAGAALHSLHMTCEAIDLHDPHGVIDDWLLTNADTVLRDLALWLEHPAATKGWAHVQMRPPRSGRRVFYP